jgi:hypothetical protein
MPTSLPSSEIVLLLEAKLSVKLRLSSDAVQRILRAAGVHIDDGGGPPVPPDDQLPPSPEEYRPPLLATDSDSMLLVDEVEWVPELDSDLAGCLQKNILFYYGAVQRRSDRKRRDRIRRLRAASKATDRLLELLKPDDVWAGMQDSGRNVLLLCLPPFRDRIASEISEIQRIVRWGVDVDDVGMAESLEITETLRRRSPFEWLVGEYLAETYERFSGERAGLSRRPSDGTLDGKYIRFVERVLIEFEITNKGRPYGRETIAKALGSVKKGRIRRKPRQ